MDDKIAASYSMSWEEAAEGVITVVNSNMVRFLREAVIGRGYDPRAFSLLAYGGAGPLHACELAAALEMKQVARARTSWDVLGLWHPHRRRPL